MSKAGLGQQVDYCYCYLYCNLLLTNLFGFQGEFTFLRSYFLFEENGMDEKRVRQWGDLELIKIVLGINYFLLFLLEKIEEGDHNELVLLVIFVANKACFVNVDKEIMIVVHIVVGPATTTTVVVRLATTTTIVVVVHCDFDDWKFTFDNHCLLHFIRNFNLYITQ